MEIYLKSLTSEQLTNIKQGDWLEGIGFISTINQANFINRFGYIIIKLQEKILDLEEEWLKGEDRL